MTKLLLCTDLDRTLLPNGAQPESPEARPLFAHLAAGSKLVLAYVTGRDRVLVQEAMDKYNLPRPQFVISDVGSNIYDLRAGDWEVWRQWQAEIAVDWNGRDHGNLLTLLADVDPLRLQEEAKQNRFKLSYYWPLGTHTADLHARLEERLGAEGIRASLIWSLDEPAGVGLLDVLPKRATKLHAVEFLRQYLGLSEMQTLFAGDSGNDLPVLASSIPSVLVANAMDSVIQEALSLASVQGNTDRLYVASGGFWGMNGNYSAGILEGLAHYHPEFLADVRTDIPLPAQRDPG
ncbi:MAG: HAD-IIB family hydrolase [Gammaproteobacteria bacterium]|nr:HAD-IIB family hydrolase [Gammaproteobacteria bacterium]MBU1653378.1 HAD-IIB family hydrolase [Gammaproteobacteria bacterium]MBU1960831.1 HAD-IIB family hydrolase [Gammaproteobacteria bacterium]